MAMVSEKVRVLLNDGIVAAKRGESDAAREALQQVVSIDPENETAWLWLSSVVDDKEDRVICLQNVLVLNPDSDPARRGLKRLGWQPEEASGPDSSSHNSIVPASPAASILYPDRYQKPIQWEDNIPLRMIDEGGSKPKSDFDDVWERDSEICAYCAQEIDFDDAKCPNCQRKLTTRAFRYPDSSGELTMYWVLLLAVAEFFLFQAILEVLVGEPYVSVLWHATMFVLFGILVAGVVLRQIWAYPASIFLLLALFTSMLLGFIAGTPPEEAIVQVVGDDLVSILSADLDYAFLRSLLSVGTAVQFVAVTGALFYGILKIGPDFERVQTRFVAKVDSSPSDASTYYATGQFYARRGMWASAILHWRRAAAHDPARAYYQRVLGEAYARLGYYDRSLDVLESALERTMDSDRQSYLLKLIGEVNRKREVEVGPSGSKKDS